MSFQVKIRMLENLWSWQMLILKDFSDEIGKDINKCDSLILNNKMCQHLSNISDVSAQRQTQAV